MRDEKSNTPLSSADVVEGQRRERSRKIAKQRVAGAPTRRPQEVRSVVPDDSPQTSNTWYSKTKTGHFQTFFAKKKGLSRVEAFRDAV